MIRIRNRLTGVILRTVDAVTLAGADFHEARLEGANLRKADLRGANLANADLSSTDLCGANLTEADLRSAVLRYAQLRGADLRDAQLEGANLRHADLSGANLAGADLTRVDLSTTLILMTNLTEAKLDPNALPVAGLCQLLEPRRTGRTRAAHTLMHLAEHHPTLQLRHAVPILRRLSGLLSLESNESKQLFRDAAARIEAAIADLTTLPVPSDLPAARGELPVPANPVGDDHNGGSAL